MKFTGEIEIAAPARDVWDLILDPSRLAACVPGAAAVRQVDDRTVEGEITTAIGPVQADFAFRSLITHSEFPDDLVVEVTGTDSMTRSRLEARVAVRLEALEGGRTRLHYQSTVAVVGRLGIVGEMVLRATAGAMINQVARCLQGRFEPAGTT